VPRLLDAPLEAGHDNGEVEAASLIIRCLSRHERRIPVEFVIEACPDDVGAEVDTFRHDSEARNHIIEHAASEIAFGPVELRPRLQLLRCAPLGTLEDRELIRREFPALLAAPGRANLVGRELQTTSVSR
jgi:hypothetical protein